MTAFRSAAVVMPSNPKPNSSERGVVIAAPTGKPEASVRMKLFAFGPLPSGGPVIAQPSRLGLERRRRPVGQHHVVEEDADALGAPVAGVGDRDLHGLPGVRRQVDAPLLPAAGVAAGRVPGAGGAGRRAGGAGQRLVVVELRVQVTPAGRAALARRRGGVPVGVRQRRPVVAARGPRLDEHVVPVRLGVVRRPEGQRDGAGRRHRDLLGEPLVGHVRDLRVDVLVAVVRVERAARLVPAGRRPARELRELVGRQDAAGRDERRRVGLVVRAVGRR